MSNTIQIKRGASIPSTDNLAKYELGFNTVNNILYINNGSGVIPVAIGTASSYGTEDPNSTTTSSVYYYKLIENEYDSEKTYNIDDTCYHIEKIGEEGSETDVRVYYKCNSESVKGVWDSTKWDKLYPPEGHVYFKIID